jgi:hypothetical protein
MAKPLKPENRRNPLRVLRELMSEKGAARPITQKELATIILVPTNTICAIEAGQRPFDGANVIYQAAATAGALWVYPLKKWMDEKMDGCHRPKAPVYLRSIRWVPPSMVSSSGWLGHSTKGGGI